MDKFGIIVVLGVCIGMIMIFTGHYNLKRGSNPLWKDILVVPFLLLILILMAVSHYLREKIVWAQRKIWKHTEETKKYNKSGDIDRFWEDK